MLIRQNVNNDVSKDLPIEVFDGDDDDDDDDEKDDDDVDGGGGDG